MNESALLTKKARKPIRRALFLAAPLLCLLAAIPIAGIASKGSVHPIINTPRELGRLQTDSAPEGAEEAPTGDQPRSIVNPAYSIPVSIGQTKSEYYQNVSDPVVFSLVSNQIQVIDLNYSGFSSASFRLYKMNHYFADDVLMDVPSLSSWNQLIPLDINVTYYLEFRTSVAGIHPFSISPALIGDSLTDRDQYVVHLEDAPSSAFGSTFSIEKIDLSLSSSTETSSELHTYYLPTYVDALSSSPNFDYDIDVDSRQVIANGLFSHHSSAAYVMSYVSYPVEGANDAGYIVYSSASFVSETITATCAHTFLNHDSKATPERSSLSMKEFHFYPGASNYGQTNPDNFHSDFGTYRATDAYLPLSFILAHSAGTTLSWVGNDWAICLTEQIEEGNYVHSYNGLTAATESSYSNAQQIAYPGIVNVPDSYPRRWMWTTIPFSNSVATNPNDAKVLRSSTLYNNHGSSGAPLFLINTYLQNGNPITKVRQIGVHSASLATGDAYPKTFEYSSECKVSHFMVNLLRYLGGLNDE